MARAAVELSSWDIKILCDTKELENALLSSGRQQGVLFMLWQEYWTNFITRYSGRTPESATGALGRLASFGFIYPAEGTALVHSPVSSLYRVTAEGKRFLTRIHNFIDEPARDFSQTLEIQQNQ